MSMRKSMLDLSTASSCSSEETDSTQTQSGLVTPTPPPQPSPSLSTDADNLATNGQTNHSIISNATTQTHIHSNRNNIHNNNHHQQLNRPISSFRKCQSYVHLTKATEKLQTSLIDCTEHSERLRKTASTPNAIYMAIKQEHHFLLMHRIFKRCKVILILFDSILCFVCACTVCMATQPKQKKKNTTQVVLNCTHNPPILDWYQFCIGVRPLWLCSVLIISFLFSRFVVDNHILFPFDFIYFVLYYEIDR